MAQSVWLITGASRGLGFDIAKTALKAGHKVITCYRGKKPDDTTKWDELEALGGIWAQLDVSSDDAESKVKALVAEHGAIDVLVNNAATPFLQPLRTYRKRYHPSMSGRSGFISCAFLGV